MDQVLVIFYFEDKLIKEIRNTFRLKVSLM